VLTLRPYQQDLYDKIKAEFTAGNQRVLAVLPCGGGKTALAAKIMQDTLTAHEQGECLLLCHRIELKNQHISTLEAYGVDTSRIRVESVFTEARRLDQHERPLLLCLDEAHLARAASWEKCVRHYNTWTLGLSATPCRLDGRSLGDVFGSMVQGITQKELTAMGRLAPFDYYAPCELDLSRVSKRAGEYSTDEVEDLVCTRTIYGDVLKSYQKFAAGRRTIAYCVSVRHSREVADMFNAAGIPSASLDGSIPSAERAAIMRKFRAGEILILSSCNILSEGLDIPAISACLLLRPTNSLALYVQQSSRALRADPEDPDKRAVILDMVGNFTRHGFPDSDREYSLTADIKPFSEYRPDGTLSLRSCGFCFKTFENKGANSSACPFCGQQYELKPREIKRVEEVELERINQEKAEAERKRKEKLKKDIRKARSYQDFVAIADANGYSLAWAKIRARHRGYSIHG